MQIRNEKANFRCQISISKHEIVQHVLYPTKAKKSKTNKYTVLETSQNSYILLKRLIQLQETKTMYGGCVNAVLGLEGTLQK
jgi:hypothetical protein